MNRKRYQLSIPVAAALFVAACASQPPLPFQLIDSRETITDGVLLPAEDRIELTLGGQRYSGFYVFDSNVVVSQGWSRWRGFGLDSISTYQSNIARASLKSIDGHHLACNFLAQDRRVVGECKSPAGATYHLTSDAAAVPPAKR